VETFRPDGLELIREAFRESGLTGEFTDFIMLSWREGTLKQYKTYLNKFVKFSGSHVDIRKPRIKDILDFLFHMFQSGYSYSAINTAKSALSVFISITGHAVSRYETLTKRFMKAVFNRRPALPRYQSIWDTDLVLEFLRDQPQNSKLTLKQLSMKLAMLLALMSGQRCQTLHALDLKDCTTTSHSIKFVVSTLVKNSKINRQQPEFIIKPLLNEPKLCVFDTLKEYLLRTRNLRAGESRIFLSYIKPYSHITKSTFSRWVKCVMSQAGINTDIFKAHSTRAAATSKAIRKDIPLESIMKAASWSTTSTFFKFYNKSIDVMDGNLL
jgi:site-specific recombinase XerD